MFNVNQKTVACILYATNNMGKVIKMEPTCCQIFPG